MGRRLRLTFSGCRSVTRLLRCEGARCCRRTGGTPSAYVPLCPCAPLCGCRLLQEDWWYEAKCQEAADSILATAQAAQEDNYEEEEYGEQGQEGVGRGGEVGGGSASNHTGEYY